MIKAIMKIHTTSSSVTFVCGDVAIIGNGEFRASSGKVDGFILYADTLGDFCLSALWRLE